MSKFRDLIITIATSAGSGPYSNGIWLLQDGEVVPGYEGISKITGWFNLEQGQTIYVGESGSVEWADLSYDNRMTVTGGTVGRVQYGTLTILSGIVDMAYQPAECKSRPIAMVYCENQEWKNIYDVELGLINGTIFEDLDLPLLKTRCSKGRSCRG